MKQNKYINIILFIKTIAMTISTLKNPNNTYTILIVNGDMRVRAKMMN
jgi:hypothetical protein